MKRHPESLRLTLLAAYCYLRNRELIDTLSDLLIDMVHRVAHRAEVRVERELIADFKRVSGKNRLLVQIAEASLDVNSRSNSGYERDFRRWRPSPPNQRAVIRLINSLAGTGQRHAEDS